MTYPLRNEGFKLKIEFDAYRRNYTAIADNKKHVFNYKKNGVDRAILVGEKVRFTYISYIREVAHNFSSFDQAAHLKDGHISASWSFSRTNESKMIEEENDEVVENPVTAIFKVESLEKDNKYKTPSQELYEISNGELKTKLGSWDTTTLFDPIQKDFVFAVKTPDFHRMVKIDDVKLNCFMNGVALKI